MKLKLVPSPPKSRAAQHGFAYAIQIDKDRDGWLSGPAARNKRSAMIACRDRLGKQYMINWQRPGKSRKWFLDQRRTFDRFYFKSESARTLVLMCM